MKERSLENRGTLSLSPSPSAPPPTTWSHAASLVLSPDGWSWASMEQRHPCRDHDRVPAGAGQGAGRVGCDFNSNSHGFLT